LSAAGRSALASAAARFPPPALFAGADDESDFIDEHAVSVAARTTIKSLCRVFAFMA
jgi:hypothetical protein